MVSLNFIRTEEETPIDERCLRLEGKLVKEQIKLEQFGVSKIDPQNTEAIFIGFAYAEIPIGKKYNVVFPDRHLNAKVFCESVIVGVTQQWGSPFPEIPHGWKTICLINFPNGIPEIINQLPVVEGWYESDVLVMMCEKQTWEFLKLNY